jgi:hypothetical protein
VEPAGTLRKPVWPAQAILHRQKPVYYRVYTRNGALTSKTVFDPTDPFLGHIETKSLHPWALKEFMIIAEQKPDLEWSFPAFLFLNPTAT